MKTVREGTDYETDIRRGNYIYTPSIQNVTQGRSILQWGLTRAWAKGKNIAQASLVLPLWCRHRLTLAPSRGRGVASGTPRPLLINNK